MVLIQLSPLLVLKLRNSLKLYTALVQNSFHKRPNEKVALVFI